MEKTEEEQRHWIQERLEAPGKIILVAEASGSLIGLLTFENGGKQPARREGWAGLMYRFV